MRRPPAVDVEPDERAALGALLAGPQPAGEALVAAAVAAVPPGPWLRAVLSGPVEDDR